MFWIKVDVREKGHVEASTYAEGIQQMSSAIRLRTRTGTTVSQALRKLAAAMVTAKAETCTENNPPQKHQSNS